MGIFLTRGESSYDPFRDLALFEQFQESCSCNFQNSVGRFSRSPCLLLCEEDHVDSALGKQPVLIVTAVSQAALITGGWNWHLVKCYWRALLSALPCLRRPGWKEGLCQPHPCNVKVYFFFHECGNTSLGERCKETNQLPLLRRENCLSSSTLNFTDLPLRGSGGGKEGENYWSESLW